jgi:phage shock protein A
MGLLKAIGRFLTFKWLWAGGKVNKAAEETFTSSAEGVGMAFDIQKDKEIKDHGEFINAVSQLAANVESSKKRLEESLEREEGLIKLRDAAKLQLAKVLKAKGLTRETAQTDPDVMKWQRAFIDYQAKVKTENDLQARVEPELQERVGRLDQLKTQLAKRQRDIKGLDDQKAQAIADFVDAKTTSNLMDRLSGLEDSSDRSAINTVTNRVAQMKQQAKIKSELEGASADSIETELEATMTEQAGLSLLDEMLAADMPEGTTETPDQTEEGELKA